MLRANPKAALTIYPPGAEAQVVEPGGGFYDRPSRYFNDYAISVDSNGSPLVVWNKQFDAMSCTLKRSTQDIGISNYSCSPSNLFEEISSFGLVGGSKAIGALYGVWGGGAETPTATSVTSNFSLPFDPNFELLLRLGGAITNTTPKIITVSFGGFKIKIASDTSPSIQVFKSDKHVMSLKQKVDWDLESVLSLTVMCGGCIAFSTNGGSDWEIYEEVEDFTVDATPLSITCNQGRFAFQLIPFVFPEGAYMYLGPEMSLNYIPSETPQFYFDCYKPINTDVTAEVTTSEGNKRQYLITLTPTTWQAVGGINFGLTPIVRSVSMVFFPVLNTPTVEAPTVITDELISVNAEFSTELNIEQLMIDDSASVTVEVDNFTKWAQSLGVYRFAVVSLGYEGEALTNIYAGYTPNLETSSSGNSPQRAKIKLIDLSFRAKETKNDASWPIFDGMPESEAMRWLGMRCGLTDDRMAFTDSGKTLSVGRYSPRFQVPELKDAWSVMQDICKYVNHELYWDGAVLTKVPRGSVSPTVHTYKGSSLNFNDELQSISVITEGEKIRNTLILKAYDQLKNPIRFWACDYDSLYNPSAANYVGFHLIAGAEFGMACTEEELYEVGMTFFNLLRIMPKRANMVVYGNPIIKRRDLIAVVDCPKSEANNLSWKVININHEWIVNGKTSTTLQGVLV